ncbi:glycosyltransferase family 4 protein [Kordiimonas aestuarii]|uniref:glycosyltransferase family 4 protein n=1 Tax=Kordiimonas aestuarii TaxID=1005925 RepID=UPI0021CE21F3|nr:glycosyltransferase family 4 protein [Kordiimonas aestuarii]
MSTMPNAAIYFEPDGYVVTGDKIMGRQAAGNSFLRAAVAQAGDAPLWCLTASERAAQAFNTLARSIDAGVKTAWCPTLKIGKLRDVGTLYLPGPNLDHYASQRLRVGIDAFSICGITHTTASHGAMDAVASLLTAPVMPWDALICTSNAAKGTVNTVMTEQMELLRWRFGHDVKLDLPRLPVIPLGIQCEDFNFTAEDRAKARAELQIGEDDIVVLFVGRLSYHAKAHPHAMMLALEEVAQKTGRNIVLVQCGWFANKEIGQAFQTAARKVCPSVRCLFTDGKNPKSRNASWAAADIFASLSDNFQETFGITPIEAMAAGLPVVVSDWDGYKDTVPDGQVGFRIPTWTLENDNVHHFAARYEAGTDSYDRYCGYTCQTVAVDPSALTDRLTALVEQPGLRQKLGEAGKKRAQATYDWAVVYKQYQALWAELASIRAAGAQSDQVRTAPKAAPTRMDPYKAFASYPSHAVDSSTRLTLLASDPGDAYARYLALDTFSYAKAILPSATFAERALHVIGDSVDIDVATFARVMGIPAADTAMIASMLAKMGLIRLSRG